MGTFETLFLGQVGGVATVTLNRPQALNAINAAMIADLEAVFLVLRADPGVRVILLTGSGDRAFAAGADIRELQQTDPALGRAVSENGQRAFATIESCGKPVIACLNGVALGGGLELALACTLRLASDMCQVGLPEARLGLIPGFGGIRRLVRQVGRSTALRMMLTAETVRSDEALRRGLVDEVLPANELMPRAREIGEAIAGLAPLAIQTLLSVIALEENALAQQSYEFEAEYFGQLFASSDKDEGLTAFLEKRQPHWRGK